MSKEHKSIKADKKKAALTPKEKKAAKKAKKAEKKMGQEGCFPLAVGLET